jgi:hypothetical protein
MLLYIFLIKALSFKSLEVHWKVTKSLIYDKTWRYICHHYLSKQNSLYVLIMISVCVWIQHINAQLLNVRLPDFSYFPIQCTGIYLFSIAE